VPNITVEIWDRDERSTDDRLGSTITLPDGSFAILFREEDFQEGFFDQKPDLYVRVIKPDGSVIFSSEENVRKEAGRRESFVAQIPREKLGELAPREKIELEDVARGVDLLSIEEEEFVEEAIGQERHARQRALTIAAIGVVALVAVLLILTRLFPSRFPWAPQSWIVSSIDSESGPGIVLIRTDETGSGVVFDKQGHILTNYHVVDGGAPYNVRLGSGNTYEAQLVGFDLNTDLAVLKIAAPQNELVVPSRGDSDRVEKGQLSIAIGNPLGLERTVTVGTVSFVGRSLETADPFGAVIDGVIQTDASINPGNSGGGLFNAKGEVIGINTQILTVGGGGSVGLGFAVPIKLAGKIAQEVITNGFVQRPFLGVRGIGTGNQQGVRVDVVVGRSSAAEAGIQPDDIILKIGQSEVAYPADLSRTMEQHRIGDRVEVTIQRAGQEQVIPVTLQGRPVPGHEVRIVEVESLAGSSDPAQEWIEIENQGYRTAYLQGYQLQSGEGDVFELPNVSLAPLRRLRVYTGTGMDTDSAIYLNASAPVWNDSGRIVLLDFEGNLSDELQK
jgi:putative serine protease PepD